MITVSDSLVFALQNNCLSHVFGVNAAGLLEHIHHGAPVREPEALQRTPPVDRECSAKFEGRPELDLNSLPTEYPASGTSDYRACALSARGADGATALALRYQSHTTSNTKPDLSPLPCARGTGSETLSVTLRDDLRDLVVTLHYTIWPGHPVIARSVTVANEGTDTVTLDRVLSASLDLPPGDYDVLHLHGSWAREMEVERAALGRGLFSVGSTRGTSSAAHAPFFAALDRTASESAGRVFASTLIYSGNHQFSAETGEFGDVRLMCGIHPENFTWRLEPSESFQSPEALQLFTDAGLRGMSHGWHSFVRAHVLPQRFRSQPRPTYLNTWEAAYFDIDQSRVLTLADTAARLGVDMLVLDDGWFEGRRDDTTSLGDWTADRARFADGIPALARNVTAKGLRFGIWFEPEMVSPDSALFRAHPDWILHQPGRTPSLGRNQLTLDLSRADVRDYLFEHISAVLDCGDVSYVKWDMNRAMTEIGSAALPPERQGEAAHRYMLGLYTLLGQLVEAFPEVLFENCASGGNRFDLGMLCFMAQSWTSDGCDPISRRSIVSGASHFLPMDCMAAYIGPSPNHQNGRVTSLRTRFLAGVMCAAQGVSLSADAVASDTEELQRYLRFARETADVRLGARFDRLVQTGNASVWQMTSADGSQVWVLDLHVLSGSNQPTRRAFLWGLDPASDYVLRDDAHGLGDGETPIGPRRFGGDALMGAGLILPQVAMDRRRAGIRFAQPGDFAAHLFIFDRVES